MRTAFRPDLPCGWWAPGRAGWSGSSQAASARLRLLQAAQEGLLAATSHKDLIQSNLHPVSLHGSPTGPCSAALGLAAWQDTNTTALSPPPSPGRCLQQWHESEGNSYLYWRREPLQLLQQLDCAVQLRKLQDALCLAVTTSHYWSLSQPWHYPHRKGMPGLESPASAPAPWDTGTMAQGIQPCEHTLPHRQDHNERSELPRRCSRA